jgi:hypothetical protein
MQTTKQIITYNLSSTFEEQELIKLASPLRLVNISAEITDGSGTFSIEIRERSGTVNPTYIPVSYTAISELNEYPDVDIFPFSSNNRNIIWIALKKDSGTINTLRVNLRFNYGPETDVLDVSRGGTGQSNVVDALNALLPSQTGNAGFYLSTDGINALWAPVAGGGGPGISDGDKGDITVSGSGLVWTIDNSTITNSKLADMSASTLKGNNTGSSGAPLDLTTTQVKSMLAITESDVANLTSDLAAKAPLASPTFTGTVVLPTNTSIGSVSSTEISYIDGVTSSIQTQLDSKSSIGHTHVVANITDYTSSTNSLISTAITAHAGAADPHTGYQLESEKNATSGYAGLDSSTLVPVALLGTGTANSSKFLRGDRVWATPAGGGGGTINSYFPSGWG